MKKTLIYVIAFISLWIGMENVNAAARVTASGKVYLNSKFTARIIVSDAAMWEVHLSSSGPVKNCSFDDVNYTSNGNNGSKTYSISCTTTGLGTISLRLTGKTITSSGKQTSISDSATVKVVERPQEKPKSSVNTLDNLWVEGASLDPTFNKDTTEYNVELESDVTSIKVGATKSDGKSSINGDGTRSVSEGMNTIKVVVTAENGSSRTYTIKANVKEKEPIIIEFDEKKYTVVRKREDMKSPSELYEETIVKINEEEIPSYYSEKTKFTLIGLKDEDGFVENYIYDQDNNTYILYQEIISQKIMLYPIVPNEKKVPIGYQKEKIEMNEKKVEAYREENNPLVLVYGMNIETGKTSLYEYDPEEGTFQRFIEKEENVSMDMLKIGFIGSASIISILLAVILALINKMKRMKKNN